MTKIFDISEFKILNEINLQLITNLSKIQEECKKLISKSDNITFKREAGDWSNDNAKNLAKNLNNNNHWVLGWTQKDNWKNYLITYENNMMKDIKENLPVLHHVLYKHRHRFNVVGLSLLEGNSEIPYHYDPDTGYEKNSLVYHFNIYVPRDYNKEGPSILQIFEKDINKYHNPVTILQETGRHIIFDSSYYHSVVHTNTDYRLILYTDFKPSEMR